MKLCSSRQLAIQTFLRIFCPYSSATWSPVLLPFPSLFQLCATWPLRITSNQDSPNEIKVRRIKFLLLHASSHFSASTNHPFSLYRYRVIISILRVVLFHFICWAPFWLSVVLPLFTEFERGTFFGSEFMTELRLLTTSLPYINCSVNWVFYALLNRHEFFTRSYFFVLVTEDIRGASPSHKQMRSSIKTLQHCTNNKNFFF
jgi:hypothetical protein